MERGTYVEPYRSQKKSVFFKGDRTHHVITFTPSSAKAKDTLYIEVPKPKDLLIVPGTLLLSFDMDIVLDPAEPGAEVNTHPVNNLAANIISRYTVKIGSNIIYDLDHAHLYNTYKDLWETKALRKNSAFKGIQTNQLSKMRADVNSTISAAGDVTSVRDVYGKRYILPLDFELIESHQPVSPKQDISFELTINTKEYVLKYKKADTADFTMKNICLEYDSIRDDILSKEIDRALDVGVPYLFDHVQHYQCQEVKKSDTLVNIEVNGLDRKSMKGILVLFQDEFTAGERDSEKFPNPKIKTIKFSIDSLPNKLYSCGYKTENQWSEISKHFVREEYKRSHDISIDIFYYYTDKFAL